MDECLSQNVQNIRRCHKVYRECHGKLESATGNKKNKNLTEVKNPDRDLPGRCTITITICNSDGATQSDT